MTRTVPTSITNPPTSAATRSDPAVVTRRLRQFLALDAVVTGGNGLVYVLAAGPLESLLGVSAGLLRPIGAVLIVYGLAVAVVAVPREPSRVATMTIIGTNAVWAAGSLLVLLTGTLSPTLVGGLWVAAQALVVGGFVAAQSWAVRRLP